MPSEVLANLTMVRPRVTDGIGLRELAMACIAFGGWLLALIGPVLILFGRMVGQLPAVSISKAKQLETGIFTTSIVRSESVFIQKGMG